MCLVDVQHMVTLHVVVFVMNVYVQMVVVLLVAAAVVDQLQFIDIINCNENVPRDRFDALL